MLEDFHDKGILPLTMDLLKSLESTVAIQEAVPFNIFADIPSGPEVLEGSSLAHKPLLQNKRVLEGKRQHQAREMVRLLV